MQSIYWVITRNCTQRCAHCYIDAGPGEESLAIEDIESIVGNFPAKVSQIILSGGEPLAEKPLLYEALDTLYRKYGDSSKYMIQTNGDLLDERSVKELLERHVCRIDIASIDEFHHNRNGRERMESLLNGAGIKYLEFPNFTDENGKMPAAAYSFWGSTPDLWLGGIWPRGRALANGLSIKNPSHNFCCIWSGAAGFLDGTSPQQEINVRLDYAYPCCPGTKVPLGDLKNERLPDMLDRYRKDPVFEALNEGKPAAMGLARGISVEFARMRIVELGSCCLWCDEFFEKYYLP